MAALDMNKLKQDLEIMDKNIRQLEKLYSDFCEGVIYREPKEMRAQTDALVQRWWGKPTANSMLRFQLQNLVQRYRTYKEKWDRQVRLKNRRESEEFMGKETLDRLRRGKPEKDVDEMFE